MFSATDAYPNDPTRNYGFPASNPFANDGDDNTLGEVYHSGFRNPWRASFDSATGDLYIGDVGFGTTEEISFAKAGDAGARLWLVETRGNGGNSRAGHWWRARKFPKSNF